MKIYKHIIISAIVILLITGLFTFANRSSFLLGGTVFNSSQIGSSAANLDILQTNGTVSTWVTIASLGITGGTWSTTTSQVSGQLINYPNNDDDIVTVGSNSTTTAEIYFDPNTSTTRFGIGTTSPYATLSVVGQIVGAYFTGTTTTASTFPYASTTALSVSGLSSGNCVQASTGGLLTTTGSACGSGGGSGGGSWSTTTSTVAGQLINYPNNDTDIVTIGSNATTSSEFWFNPNNLRALIPYASSTYLTASTGAHFIADTTLAAIQTIRVGNPSAGDNLIAVQCGHNYSSAASTLGCANFNNTLNDRPAISIYSNATGGSGNGIFTVHSDNAGHTSGLVYIRGDGTNGSEYELRMDGVNPDAEWVATSQTEPAGKYEIDVNANDDVFRFSGRNAANSGFYPTMIMQRQDTGGRLCLGCGTPWNTSHIAPTGGILDLVSTTTDATTPDAFLTLSTRTVGAGDVLKVLSNTGATNGYVGIGTTSPYSKLSVVGNVVANHYISTSTAPVVSSCGTSPSISGGASDHSGKVTLGTSIGVDSDCTITFSTTLPKAPACFANNESRVLLVRAVTTQTTLTISVAATFTDSDVISYGCIL